MSENEKNVQETQNVQEEKKIVTKYDRKMREYEEMQKKAKRDKIMGTIGSVVLLVAVVALVASFPIRRYMQVNETYVTINGEKISRVVYDYNYNISKNSYLAQYAQYFAMFGMTDLSDIESQPYDDTMTMKDYFNQTAVQNMIQTRALRDQAKAEGFTYDVTPEYTKFIEKLKREAEANGKSYKDYLISNYGDFATEGRLKDEIELILYTGAYVEKVQEEKKAPLADVEAYYAEHKEDYDSVDYFLQVSVADIPTESPEGVVEVDEDGNEIDYVPSDKDIERAMAKAKIEAYNAKKTIQETGESCVNYKKDAVPAAVQSYLFFDRRREGDMEVIEDTNNHRYYTVYFVNRYRDETPTVDMRAIVTMNGDSQAILAEYDQGAKTEDSFIELVEKYDEMGMASRGGLYESVAPASSGLGENMEAWLKDPARQKGDVASFNPEDGYQYIIYYLESGDAAWKVRIGDILTAEIMSKYMEEIVKPYTVKDVKGFLKQEAAANTESAAQ